MPTYKQTLDDVVALSELLTLLPNTPFIIPGSVRNPNYVPPSRAPAIISVAIVSWAICSVFVFMKLYTRIRSNYGFDDLFTAISYVCFTGFTLVQVLGAKLAGLGYHVYDLSIRDIENTLRVFMSHSILYISVGSFTRISVLLLFARITSFTSVPKYHRAINSLIVISGVYWLIAVCLVAFSCHPLNYPNGDGYYALMGVRTGLDLAIMATPIVPIMELSMSFKRKINLIVLLLLGIITVFMGLMRMYVYYNHMLHNFDQTWFGTEVGIWGQVESMLAVVIACLPALNHLIVSSIPSSLRGTSKGGSRGINTTKGSLRKTKGSLVSASATQDDTSSTYQHKSQSKVRIVTTRSVDIMEEFEMPSRDGGSPRYELDIV